MNPQTVKGVASRHSLVASDRVEGTDVRRPGGDRIGTIQRLMIDKASGKVAYAVLRYGGFLGMGEKRFPVPWASLRYNPKLEAYELEGSEAELGKAPSYASDDDFDWGDREGERALHDHYKVPPYWGI